MNDPDNGGGYKCESRCGHETGMPILLTPQSDRGSHEHGECCKVEEIQCEGEGGQRWMRRSPRLANDYWHCNRQHNCCQKATHPAKDGMKPEHPACGEHGLQKEDSDPRAKQKSVYEQKQ